MWSVRYHASASRLDILAFSAAELIMFFGMPYDTGTSADFIL